VTIYTFTALDGPAGTNAIFPRGINGSGQIAGYYDSNSSEHGFLYSGGIYVTVDDPFSARSGTSGSDANGINDAGQVVGKNCALMSQMGHSCRTKAGSSFARCPLYLR
jgi:uncharacterized membrane protein